MVDLRSYCTTGKNIFEELFQLFFIYILKICEEIEFFSEIVDNINNYSRIFQNSWLNSILTKTSDAPQCPWNIEKNEIIKFTKKRISLNDEKSLSLKKIRL